MASHEELVEYHRSFLSPFDTDVLRAPNEYQKLLRKAAEVEAIRLRDPEVFEEARKDLRKALKVPYSPGWMATDTYRDWNRKERWKEGFPLDAKVAEAHSTPTRPAEAHSPRRLRCASLIFCRASSLCGLPVRPFLIASMTCGGLGLPRLAALILARRSAMAATAIAAGLASSSTGDSSSLLSFVVPSLYCATPSALRHCQTVACFTPQKCITASADSRFTASARSPYSTSERDRPFGSV
jgi:hypothetical protein